MYLKTLLDQYEYMEMPIALLPTMLLNITISARKPSMDMSTWKYKKGMYGLKQAGILANKILKKQLACHGYFEQPHTPGLWKHVSPPIWFNLCMDDFGI
jgi:hypothetical protein